MCSGLQRTLLEPRRTFKLEADLSLSKSLQRKGRRRFLLFNDLLIIAKSKKDTSGWIMTRDKEERHANSSALFLLLLLLLILHWPLNRGKEDKESQSKEHRTTLAVKVWLPLTHASIKDIEDTPGHLPNLIEQFYFP